MQFDRRRPVRWSRCLCSHVVCSLPDRLHLHLHGLKTFAVALIVLAICLYVVLLRVAQGTSHGALTNAFGVGTGLQQGGARIDVARSRRVKQGRVAKEVFPVDGCVTFFQEGHGFGLGAVGGHEMRDCLTPMIGPAKKRCSLRKRPMKSVL